MRDSINYNLKYFIMKMSGTKPMKNTMRKPSPIKQGIMGNASGAVKAATNLASTVRSAKAKKETAVATPRPTAPKKPTDTKKVTPAMQLKKHKC